MIYQDTSRERCHRSSRHYRSVSLDPFSESNTVLTSLDQNQIDVTYQPRAGSYPDVRPGESEDLDGDSGRRSRCPIPRKPEPPRSRPTSRGPIRAGRVFGWYFLPAIGGYRLPEMIVDLRQLHTVRLDILNELCRRGHRRARLLSPYREHLAKHFADTYSRIGLPEPYDTQP